MSIPLVDQPTEEKLVILKDVSWEQFKGIEGHLQHNHSVKLTYLSGLLEIMSPVGDKHEEVNRSGFLPNLDPALLLHYIAMPDQYDAVSEFQQMIRHQQSE
jgi:hypothetical protein